MASQSPLKAKPLRNPGDSVDQEIDRHIENRFTDILFAAACFCLLALYEWIGYLAHIPRQPIIMSCMAVAAVVVAAWRFAVIRTEVRQLKLGRDGERCVGQYLERLRASNSQVFHDIPAHDFNLDHVVISIHGIYAVETKTFSKPSPNARVTVDGNTIRVGGSVPDRNPIDQSPRLHDGSRICSGNRLVSNSKFVVLWCFRGGSLSRFHLEPQCGSWNLRCYPASSSRNPIA